MAKTQEYSWKFPLKQLFFFRIELLFVLVLAVLIFIFSFTQTDQSWLKAIILTLAFIGIYALLSYFLKKIRVIEEHYHLTPTHFEAVKKSKNKVDKVRMHLKDLKHHKLDKYFLGGYLLTHKGDKHLLFFNTKNEVNKFEQFLKKHLEKIRGKPQKIYQR